MKPSSDNPVPSPDPTPKKSPKVSPDQLPDESPDQSSELKPDDNLPVLLPPQGYHIISIPKMEPPRILYAASAEDMAKIVRGVARDDQQHLFIIKGGELGRLAKTHRGLLVKFSETEEKIRIRMPDHEHPIEDGWLGD